MNIDQRTKAIALIVFGLVIAAFALVYPFGKAGDGVSGPVLLPDEIAGLARQNEMYGLEAVENITRLHGKDFSLMDGAVGGYGEHGEITVWVSISSTEEEAAQLLIAMREKIAEGNSPYELVGEERMGRRVVYELTGLGMRHYYFQSQNQVIWLAADPLKAEEALAQSLVFYP